MRIPRVKRFNSCSFSHLLRALHQTLWQSGLAKLGHALQTASRFEESEPKHSFSKLQALWKKQWCVYMFLLFVYYIMWYFFLFYWEPCGGVLFHVLNSFSKLFVGLLSRAALWNFQLRCLGHSSTWFQARWAHGSHTCGTPRRERFNSDKFWWRYRPLIKRTTFLDANRNQTRN
jgi:hypothetical protein